MRRSMCAMGGLAWAGGCAFTVPLDDHRTPDSGAGRIIQVMVDSASSGNDALFDVDIPCDIVAAVSLPQPDSRDAYYRDPIQVQLSAPDPSMSIRLLTTAGESVDGMLSASPDATLVSFTPSAPLTPGLEYRATASFCDGSESLSWGFTVGPAGTPLDCALPGTAFHIDLTTARWTTPPGFGGVIPLLSAAELLVGVHSDDAGRVDAIAAPGTPTTQDTCAQTSPLPTAVRSGPDLSLPTTHTTLTLGGHPITLSDWRLDSTVLPDCSGLAGGRTQGSLDVRELAAAVSVDGIPSDPGALCSFLATYGTECSGCDSDGQPYCFPFDVAGIGGTALPAPLVCVQEESCHPSCASSTCDDPATGECLP